MNEIALVCLVAAPIIIVLGAFMIFKTELLWKIETFLTVKNGEPTDFYLAMNRLAGLVLIIAGVVMIIYGVISLFSGSTPCLPENGCYAADSVSVGS